MTNEAISPEMHSALIEQARRDEAAKPVIDRLMHQWFCKSIAEEMARDAANRQMATWLRDQLAGPRNGHRA
jgi:hypothetical protein